MAGPTVPLGIVRDERSALRPPARTTAEAIAQSIRADIIGGRYDAGERLRQVELAKQYEVSTTPVREAFAILQRQGLVRLHPQRGASAIVPNTKDLEELYEIRVELECLAVQHAARNFTPADAPALRELIAQMRVCRDADQYVELNHHFHMGIYRLAQRERLVEMIEQLRMASQAYLQITSDRAVILGDAENEHDDILDACEANDPARAAAATRDHLGLTVANAVAQLDHADATRGLASARAIL
ncbi:MULTISPECIES: GntR family transcriptional regulator [Microbacterium]|uniref:GntR family transcriptional regulator n=1 Tax=Microbacterium TaxID=33882 RepID=UPI000D65DD92|nr:MULTISPECIES: GntR family transcriptional regulator [Microbacterium]